MKKCEKENIDTLNEQWVEADSLHTMIVDFYGGFAEILTDIEGLNNKQSAALADKQDSILNNLQEILEKEYDGTHKDSLCQLMNQEKHRIAMKEKFSRKTIKKFYPTH